MTKANFKTDVDVRKTNGMTEQRKKPDKHTPEERRERKKKHANITKTRRKNCKEIKLQNSLRAKDKRKEKDNTHLNVIQKKTSCKEVKQNH